MAHIFIATPMFSGACMGEYTQSLINLMISCGLVNHTTSFIFTINESLITRARNTLVHNFFKTDASHLLFIDADMRFDGKDVIPMIDANVDVICAVCPKKEINWGSITKAVVNGVPASQLNKHTGSFTASLIDKKEINVLTNKPLEVKAGGTGFMLIKRKVFEKLKPTCPKYLDGTIGSAGEEYVTKYFDTSIDPKTEKLLSEDYHFCYAFRKMGGKIHCAPWAKIAHIGTYTFEGELVETTEPPGAWASRYA